MIYLQNKTVSIELYNKNILSLFFFIIYHSKIDQDYFTKINTVSKRIIK